MAPGRGAAQSLLCDVLWGIGVLPSVCLLVGAPDEAKQACTDRTRSAEYDIDGTPYKYHCDPAKDHHADRSAQAEVQPLADGQYASGQGKEPASECSYPTEAGDNAENAEDIRCAGITDYT